jgi:hypothetical protein
VTHVLLNFRAPDEALFAELGELTKAGLENTDHELVMKNV